MKILCVLAVLLTCLSYLGDGEDHQNLLILQHIDDLRLDNPDVSEECVVVAANILAGRYEDVQHMMNAHGRCATSLVGLRVRVTYTGDVK
jgi:hypothetical protein